MRLLLVLLLALSTLSGAEESSNVALAECTGDPASRQFLIDPAHPGARDDGTGSGVQPWKTLAAVSRRDLRAGDLIRLRGGIYRGRMRPKVDGLVIEGCPGEDVTVTGAFPMRTEWTQREDTWTAGTYRPFPGEAEDDRNLVVVNGSLLMPARDGALSSGSYRIQRDEHGSATLVLNAGQDVDVPSALVEAGIHDVLFGPANSTRCEDLPRDVPGHTLRNLTFVHAANPAQTGAVCLWGVGARAEGLRILETNSRGLENWGSEHVIRDVIASRNGHLGLGGGCVNCAFEDITADENNWRGHDPFWEAGGGKWVETSGTVFRRMTARNNEGPGIWLDGDSHDNLIEGAVAEGNVVSGIQIELGSDRNRVVDSRVAETRRDGWSASGVLVMAAGETVLEGNTVVDNQGSGVWVRVDSRRSTGGISLYGNRFVGNATRPGDHDYQVRIDLDVAPGGTPPPVHLNDNVLDETRPRHVAAMRQDRESRVERFETGQALIDRLAARKD
ncbi:MAG: right-handed parallel beta-helix repeat-containing protein [Rhodothermales bacterium]|nr:right-handed parallel beta-helix repeat-containing protein [Rhodothermales bacterium]